MMLKTVQEERLQKEVCEMNGERNSRRQKEVWEARGETGSQQADVGTEKEKSLFLMQPPPPVTW